MQDLVFAQESKQIFQIEKEEGTLLFAEGEVASTFAQILLGESKPELVAEIVTEVEERGVGQVLRGPPGVTFVLVKRNVEQADALAVARCWTSFGRF